MNYNPNKEEALEGIQYKTKKFLHLYKQFFIFPFIYQNKKKKGIQIGIKYYQQNNLER